MKTFMFLTVLNYLCKIETNTYKKGGKIEMNCSCNKE